MKDTIVEEMRKIKEEQARKYDFDVMKMAKALMKQQEKRKRTATLPAKRRAV